MPVVKLFRAAGHGLADQGKNRLGHFGLVAVVRTDCEDAELQVVVRPGALTAGACAGHIRCREIARNGSRALAGRSKQVMSAATSFHIANYSDHLAKTSSV